MTLFLINQMAQQAVMKISLKMTFPKDSLASMTISSGCSPKFQLMGIVFQQV
jgi:hypothetical protein